MSLGAILSGLRIADGWTAYGPRRIARAGLATLFASLVTIAAPNLNEGPQSEGADTFELGTYSAQQPAATVDRHSGSRDAVDSTYLIGSTSGRTFFAADSQGGVAGGGAAAALNVADDHGDEASTSTDISTGMPVKGIIEATDDADYFRLILGQPSLVSIYTTGELDTVGRLIDSDGREVVANDDSGKMANFRIEANLDPGIHYLQMRAVANATGRYELHADARASALARFTNSIGMEFVLVPAGEFDMGSTSDEARSNEQPVTRVQISRGFYMGKHEVTQGQWEAVMGNRPSHFGNCGGDCPVEQVSWSNVQEFVRKLNEIEGGTAYRLPTEAEWEYAARAGTTGERYSDDLDAIAWWSGNSEGRTHPVGRKKPSAFDLHDMLGNVAEWVQDPLGNYLGGTITDPTGPSSGSLWVNRGGTFSDPAWAVRAAFRPSGRTSSYSHHDLGFRLAMSLDSQQGIDLSDATPLAIGSSVVGRIGPGDDVDYFSLEVNEPTIVAIYTAGSLDTLGSLRDSANAKLAGDDDGGVDGNFRIETTLGPGTHYVRVESYHKAGGVYTLFVEAAAVETPPAPEMTNTLGMDFALVPAGEFEMGSGSGGNNERPVTQVRISRAFYIGKHEVTQGQWQAVMGSNPSSGTDCGSDCPVERISWVDAQEFVWKLNEKEDTTLYRLPTEAEWEYAARAGTTGERYWTNVDEIAWHEGNSGDTPHPVGQKRANAFGLHDMLGNVWEWVWDWNGAYTGWTVTDPLGPSTGSERVARGGGFSNHASVSRVSERGSGVPSERFRIVGFRLALTAEGPAGGRPAVDDHGNQPLDATELVIGAVVDGRIEVGTDVDYFRLELSEAAEIEISTTGDLDTTGSLRDSEDQEVVADNDSGEGRNFRIVASLGKGVHYVRVASMGPATGAYRLQALRRPSVGTPGGSLVNDIGMELVWIPPGEFDMGSTSDVADGDERRVTRVRISTGFYMGKYEVTQGQWEAVMGSNPSWFSNCGADCPVESVSWEDVQEFVQRLNEREGVTLYRLPTEAEWEYAARGGTTEERYSTDLDSIAWYDWNSGGTTHPVGQKVANAFGLHDMLGNVREWVQDWHGRYSGGNVTDPTGPSSGRYRVQRGGAWCDAASNSRAPERIHDISGCNRRHRGFRLVYALPAGPPGLGPWGADDHVDEPSQATALAIGAVAEGRIQRDGDVDYFRFDLSEPTQVVIYTTGGLDTVGSLRDGKDTEAAGDDNSGDGNNFSIITELLPAGSHYVRVSGKSLGAYMLHVKWRAGASAPPPLLTNSIGMEFTLIPGGAFDMGSTSSEAGSDESPVTRVRISQGFYMGKYEVTQGQWLAVMENNPSRFPNCGVDCPVEWVSWSDAQEFVRKLNELEATAVYRLPTEAEWEYAARANTMGDRYLDDLDAIAWCGGNSGRRTHPVGRKLPNSFGLYDMLGNVWEWVQDWHSPYPGGTVTDPLGPNSGTRPMRRGGSWYHRDSRCRAATRVGRRESRPSEGDVGFRLAMTVSPGGAGLPQPPAADDHGDDLTNATPVNFGQSIEGRIETGADADYFLLSLTEWKALAIYTTGTLNTVARLLDSTGGLVAENDDPAESQDRNFRIETTLDAGIYYVRVESHLVGTGSYTLHLEEAADDHGDDFLSATQIKLGESQSGRIETPDDEDYFIFGVGRQTSVAIYTTGSLNTAGRLFDINDSSIASDRYSGAGSNFRIEQTLDAGVYYIRVWSNRRTPGAYELHVESIP